MGEVSRIPRAPRPDPEVVCAVESVLDAANSGIANTVFIMTVNPLGEVETCAAGDLSHAGRLFLVRALYQAATQLFLERPADRG